MTICLVPRLPQALSALQSSSIVTQIHLYKSHTHTCTYTLTHQLTRCKTETIFGVDLKEEADSEFCIVSERFFQRVGAECEKALWL